MQAHGEKIPERRDMRQHKALSQLTFRRLESPRHSSRKILPDRGFRGIFC
jgi:hypothetical protein